MRRRLIGLPLALIVLLVAMTSNETRGQSDLNGNVTGAGSLGVNPINISVDAFTGGASSSFGFGVPPGRSGLEPDLSLTYNSGSTSPGLVGIGWDLNLPFIQRDTRNGQPAWSWTDTFSLRWNGRTLQLWMQSDQTKNGVGTREFRTKIQTFMRIRSYSSSGGVPTYWEVWDGSGRKYQFGGTTHTSTAYAQVNDFKWGLNNVTDQYGNYMDIDYWIGSGTLYPDKITYTGNSNGLTPKNKVEFLYEGRYDVTTSRLGKTSEMDHRLRSVRTWAGSTPVAVYVLDYTTPTSNPPGQPTYFCQSCSLNTVVCPNGNIASCQDTCDYSTGFCSVCTPTCTICTGVVCSGTTSKRCPDRSTATCTNTCDYSTGQCGCTPTCRTCLDCTSASATATTSSTFSSQDEPSLLSRISQYDASGTTSLPPTTFTYKQDTSADKGWTTTFSSGLVPESFEQMTCTSAGTTLEQRAVRDWGIQVEDINRDGRPDVLRGYNNTCLSPTDPINARKVYTGNQSFGWDLAANWALPEPFVISDCGKDYDNGVRLVDIDGDGLTDLVRSVRTSFTGAPDVRVYLNSGSGWTLQPAGTFAVPVAFVQIDAANHRSMDLGVRFADINGDGRIDMIQSLSLFPATNAKLCGLQARDEKGIYLNNVGSHKGWTLQSAWTVPEPLALEYCDSFVSLPLVGDAGTRLLDVNGDGLVDMFRSATVDGTFIQTLRLGKGYNDVNGGPWEQVTDWALPQEDFNVITSSKYSGKDDVDDRGVRFADVNADGMIDMVVGRQWDGVTTQMVYLHRAGKGWVYDPEWVMADVFVTHLPRQKDDFDEGVRLVDVSGRGRAITVRSVDTVNCTEPSGRQLRGKNDTSFQNLLTSSVNGLGGSTSLAYTRSTAIDNTGGDGISDLGFLLPVVQSITQKDGLSFPTTGTHTYQVTYSHAGGLYNHNSREFRGFRYIRSDEPGTNAYVETLFIQDPGYDIAPLTGAVERTAVRRWTDGAVFSVVQNTFEHDSRSGNPPFFDRLLGTDSYLLEFAQAGVAIDAISLSAPVKETSTGVAYTFDTGTGERFITSRIIDDAGDLSTPDDDLYMTDEFINDSANWRVGLLKRRTLSNVIPDVVIPLADEWLMYDNLAYGNASLGNVTAVEQWPGIGTSDAQGAATNIRTTFQYDDYGHVKAESDPSGHTRFMTYGGADDPNFIFPTQVKVATTDGTRTVEHLTLLKFDPRFGTVSQIQTPADGTITYEYDTLGRVTKMYNGLDSAAYPTRCYQYNLTSVPAMYASFVRESKGMGDSCGPNGMLASAAFFDGMGRRIETKTETAEPGFASTITSAFAFNAQWRLWLVLRPFSSADDALTYTPVPFSSPHAGVGYDIVGRRASFTLPAPPGSTTPRSWATTYSGWTITTKDPAGRQQESDLDAHGQVLRTRYIDPVTEGVYATTTFTYDHLGQMGSIRDDAGNTTTFHFDALGRLTGIDEPNATIVNEYNPDGTLRSTKKRQPGVPGTDGFGASYTYDEMHRPLSATYLDQTGPVYHYDEYLGAPFPNARATAAIDHLTSAADSSTGIRQEFYYDTLGRPVGLREQVPQGASSGGLWYPTSWTLDAMGRTAALAYPDPYHGTVLYTYGVDGRVAAISNAMAQPLVSNIRYGPTGLLTSAVYGNGLTVSYGREDATDWLTHIGACFNCTSPTPTTVVDATYTETLNGLIQSIVDKDGTGAVTKRRLFTLDMLDRLTKATITEGTSSPYDLAYTYDTIGNLTSKEGVAFGYGGSDPHEVTTTSSGLTLTYGVSGEARSILDGQGKGRAFDYTGAGRISHVLDTQAGTEAFYLYDPSGSRARRQEISNSGTTETIIPSGLYEESGGTYKKYIKLGGTPIAEVDGTFSAGDQQTYYFVGNELDGTSVVTDQSQAVVQRIEYRPYGEISKITAGNFTPAYMFAGARRDAGTGLYDYGARFYDASLGRFLTTDPVRNNPLDLTNLNPYAYASGNPTSLVDIGGLSTGDPGSDCPADACLDYYGGGTGGLPPGGSLPPGDTSVNLNGVLGGIKHLLDNVGSFFGFGGGHHHWPQLGNATAANTRFSIASASTLHASAVGSLETIPQERISAEFVGGTAEEQRYAKDAIQNLYGSITPGPRSAHLAGIMT